MMLGFELVLEWGSCSIVERFSEKGFYISSGLRLIEETSLHM